VIKKNNPLLNKWRKEMKSKRYLGLMLLVISGIFYNGCGEKDPISPNLTLEQEIDKIAV
jgi:hypothetical protein